MPSFFTPSSASLQHFLQTLSRLEEAFLLSPLSGLEQEGAVRRMRFAVDAGLKAMKDHLAASGHLPDTPTPPAVLAAAWRRRIIFDGHIWMDMLARRSQLARDDSPETLQAAVKELESRFLPELARLRDWLVQHPCSGEIKQLQKKRPRPLDGASLFVGTSLPRSYTMIFSFAHFYYYYSGHQLLAPDRMCCA